jgi:phage gp36-like protein
MGYAVKQDMIDRFGDVELKQLTDRTGAVDAIDDTVLGKALADADAEINGYLAGRYTLPLASTPMILVGLACDIARFRLYEDRATEQVRQRYEDAIKYLTKVAEGKISLGLDAGNQAQTEAGGAKAEGDERVFSRETLNDYL